ncbi:MAG: CHAT domain-containing protein [Myxococcota bacterium]
MLPHPRQTAALLAALTLGGACPSAPPTKPEADRSARPTPTLTASAPAVVPFDPATRHLAHSDADLDQPTAHTEAALERRVWKAAVLPLKPSLAGDEGEMLRGIGLADVLVRMLTLRGVDSHFEGDGPIMDLVELQGISSFFEYPGLFPTTEAEAAWLADPAATTPPGLATTELRWVVGGNLLAPDAPGGPGRVFLWLMDRVAGKVWSGTCAVDAPRLQRPRFLLLKLLSDAGQTPTEIERGDMLWTEDLSEAALQALGKAQVAAALGDPERARPVVAALLAVAPVSYCAWLAYAHGVANPSATECERPVAEAIDRAIAINPHVDVIAQTHALSCQLGALMGGMDNGLEGLWREGTTNCSVAGKAIASIGGGREVPGSGFLAGLGGIYRGGSCRDSGAFREQERLAEQARDPFVKASLYMDAALGAIGADALGEADSMLANARLALARIPAPHDCLAVLTEAELDLHAAGLGLQRSDLDETRRQATAAATLGDRCADPRVGARADNLVGLAEQAAGHYDKALQAFKRAYDVFDDMGDEMNLGVAHNNLGWTRVLLGQNQKALPDLQAALALKRRVRSDGGVAVALENLGVTYMTLGRFAEAEPLLVEARGMTRDETSQAAIANNLARIRAGQGRQDEAHALLDEARELARRSHARALEAQIEQTTGGIAAEHDALREAFDAFNKALVIRREVGDRAGEGLTLSSLMVVAARLHKTDLAIVYGKLAVAAHQDVKQSAKGVDAEAERDFLKTREQTYRRLAELLVQEGRLIEAERVLALLKITEADDWTRSVDASASSAVPLTKSEKDLEKRYRAAADQVMAVGREYGALAAQMSLTPADEKRLAQLRAQLETANGRFGKFLASLADQKVTSKGIDDLREGTGIGPDLAELPGTVAVYTLVTEDAYHAIVVSADAQVAESVQLPLDELNTYVSNFRNALQDPQSDPRPAAQELYDRLVAPIAKHLDQAQARTIIWSLDRALRYVPMGALWDGEKYLVERWPSAVFTPASRARLKDKPLSNWRVLAAGVTKGQDGFPPLPAVKSELDGIVDDPATSDVDGALPGVEIMDDGFGKDELLALLARKWPVVHIASHFAFTPGDKDLSFLVLGKGRLTVTELENLPNLFQGVDLLTLSACNTATGDSDDLAGREVESFAVLAQRKGARAVLATLWPVADRSTGRLMQRFYELHNQAGMSKLEALRQAQLEMLHGKLGASAAPPAPGDALPPDWSHPYYWAPFVLVGNTQ